MARTNPQLVMHIRNAAKKLASSTNYQWGHMGSCNCGFLAQEISKLSKSEIHERAMQKYGDWNEQVDAYCPTTGLPMDELISEMLSAGLDREDLKNLEKLDDPKVLRLLPVEQRNLVRNNKDDVVLYLNTWAMLLENQLLDEINISQISYCENQEIIL